jgi:phenylacetate-CoA ligase
VLDTAFRQLRYGLSLVAGRKVAVHDVRALVADALASRAEYGTIGGDEQLSQMRGAIDPESRRAVDARRWRTMVHKAYDETVYYRRRLDELAIDPDTLTLDRVADLPPTPKEAVRALPEAFVSRKAAPVFQAWTTGTTGVPTSFWFSSYELDLAAGLSGLSFLLAAGLGPEDVVQISLNSRAVLGIQNTLHACRLINAGAYLSGFIDPSESLARLATPVHLPGKKPRTSVMTTNPSYLAALIAAAERQGYRPADFGLEQILCGGELLSDSLRARAEETFDAEIIDNYAMTEAFPVAGLACRERHLHITTEQGLVEVLRPSDFAPAQAGEVGMLVITPFYPYRETTLLLRLATGDLVRALDTQPESCEYAGLPATSRLLGRQAHAADDRPPLFQRDVLDLLEAERALPLPVRYAVRAGDDGFDLDVLADRDDPLVRSRLESGIADRDLPIRKLQLHTDPDTMPQPAFYRALLHETTVARTPDGQQWTLR